MALVSSIIVEGSAAAVAPSAEDGDGNGSGAIDLPHTISVELRPPTLTFFFKSLGTTVFVSFKMTVVRVVGGAKGWRLVEVTRVEAVGPPTMVAAP